MYACHGKRAYRLACDGTRYGRTTTDWINLCNIVPIVVKPHDVNLCVLFRNVQLHDFDGH
jgi:hypothetical protein